MLCYFMFMNFVLRNQLFLEVALYSIHSVYVTPVMFIPLPASELSWNELGTAKMRLFRLSGGGALLILLFVWRWLYIRPFKLNCAFWFKIFSKRNEQAKHRVFIVSSCEDQVLQCTVPKLKSLLRKANLLIWCECTQHPCLNGSIECWY